MASAISTDRFYGDYIICLRLMQMR